MPVDPSRSSPRHFDYVVVAPADDPRLARAAARAHRRLHEFIDLLRQRPPGVRFMVKAAFPRTDEPAALKHMWVRVDSMEGGNGGDAGANGGVFVGTLESDSQGKTVAATGDRVRIPISEIEDWLYDRGDKKHTGGFSMPVLDQIDRERRTSKK